MAFDNMATSPGSVDVAICGGGFAGLLLARQLSREHPDLSVAVIDRLERPLPEAAFKVGESTVELAAYYMRDMLGLAEYLDGAHLRKMGLRFFFKSTTGKFVDRPEYGLSKFATHPTYQIDRGRLENDLRAMIEADGVQMIEGARIDALVLGEDGAAHEVRYYQGSDGSEVKSLTARWLVDSSGRSRMLQRQLGLSKQREADHHAVWFRVEGKLDVEDLVPDSETDWHDRVPGRKRFHATVHLVDKGYWVWLIPLASGHTSVGIVATKDYHPLEGFKSREKAMEWLHKHEPDLAARMAAHPMMDFGVIRNYSHTSGQVFSGDRWACTGDAGVFSDPMYSPGADLIAFANTSISWLIGEDKAGRLTHEMAEEKSKFVISIGELLTRSIQVNYHLLGSPVTMAAKLFWDITAGWAVVQPLMFGQVFLDSERHKAVRNASRQFFFMSLQMNTLFTEWAKKSGQNASYEFIDYFKVAPILEMRARNLTPGKSTAELVEDQHLNMALMEELAVALFKIAVADVLPEHAHKLEGKWLNAWSVSLDPDKWEERGLFAPRTPSRDISHFTDPLNRMFRVRELQV